jgi:hypothetical protein
MESYVWSLGAEKPLPEEQLHPVVLVFDAVVGGLADGRPKRQFVAGMEEVLFGDDAEEAVEGVSFPRYLRPAEESPQLGKSDGGLFLANLVANKHHGGDPLFYGHNRGEAESPQTEPMILTAVHRVVDQPVHGSFKQLIRELRAGK